MTESLLFVNACPRERGVSRTLALCDELLTSFAAWNSPPEVSTLSLNALRPQPIDADTLQRRDALLHSGALSDPMFVEARRFAQADLILIGAPYWDLSFPAALKCYIEMLCVNGIAFHYTKNGNPEGLCHARALIYATSAGGMIAENNHGLIYLRAIAGMLGIGRVEFLSREGLDILGLDPIVEQKKSALRIAEISRALELR